LEDVAKLVGLEEGGFGDVVVVVGFNFGAAIFALYLFLDELFVFDGRPEETNVCLVLPLHRVQVLV
jgi:hypothetical protein